MFGVAAGGAWLSAGATLTATLRRCAPPKRLGWAAWRSSSTAAPGVLRVFARTPHSAYTHVDLPRAAGASELKDAVIAKLQLGVPPHAVRLLRERRGGAAAVPVDETRRLAPQGVRPGCRLVAATALPGGSSVLVHGPDATLDAGLLAELAAPDAPGAGRVRALSQLSLARLRAGGPSAAAADPATLPLFDTEAHTALLRHLSAHAGALAAGRFAGTTGAACGVLVGARGAGKTTVLRAFAAVAASAFPGLIALYVSGEGIDGPESPFRGACLLGLIAAAARSRGVNDLHPQGLDAGLREAGLRVLVLVDEVDDLYRVSLAAPHAAVRANVVSTLGKLAQLAGQASGLYGVLLCGSSSSTYHLLCGPTAHLRDKFPLVASGVPDMNRSKMPRIRLPLAPCSASGEVAGMLTALVRSSAPQAQALPLHSVLPMARLLTFFVGASPRAVCAAVAQGSPLVLGAAALAAAGPAAPLSTDFPLPHTLPLYQALLLRLAASNAALRGLTRCSDGTANVVALVDPGCAWEGSIAPLAWGEVKDVWVQCAAGLGLPVPAGRDELVLQRMLEDLVDAHLLRQGVGSGGATELWPATAAQAAAAGEVPTAWLAQGAAGLAPLGKALHGVGGAAQSVVAAATLAGMASKFF